MQKVGMACKALANKISAFYLPSVHQGMGFVWVHAFLFCEQPY